MAFVYDIVTAAIVDAEDGGLIADLVETVEPDDGFKMAAAPELYDALQAILYANEIGELPLPKSLVECATEAMAKADQGEDLGL